MIADGNDQTLEAQQVVQPEVTIPEGGGVSDVRDGPSRTEFDSLNQKLDTALEEIKRTRQSLGDQNKAIRDRITAELKELDELKAATGLSDRKYEELADDIKAKAFQERKEPEAKVAQPAPQAPKQPEAQLSIAERKELELGVSTIHYETGVPLFRNDPEFRELEKLEASRAMSINEYLEEYRNAVERKALREGEIISPPTNSRARVPGPSGGLAGNNPIENINDPHTLINSALSKMGQRR